MRVAVIIPDRKDRPAFMENCLRMMFAQTLKPERILTIDYPPESDKCDITQRYRLGYDMCRDKGFDIIAFIENDDWYSPNYLEYMTSRWNAFGRPSLFGNNYTIYYHLKLRKYFKFLHVQRASAMNTFIVPDLKMNWPRDHDPYTDQWLWITPSIKKKMAVEPEFVVSIGMKHGIGKIGGVFHDLSIQKEVKRYINDDNGFLRNTLDDESYNFYSSVFANE